MNLAARLRGHRLTLAWIFAAAFLYWAKPTPATIVAGTVFFVAGASLRTWAAGHIRKREVLAVTGPYAYTRNPLYFGSFLMSCGALVMGRNPWLAAGFLCVAVPVYRVVIRNEEELLAGKFGEAFAAYVRDVPRFFPRFAVRPGSRGTFDWGLVRRHREWRSWAGGAALLLLLLLRWFWTRGQ